MSTRLVLANKTDGRTLSMKVLPMFTGTTVQHYQNLNGCICIHQQKHRYLRTESAETHDPKEYGTMQG